jgi:hypothetical protein
MNVKDNLKKYSGIKRKEKERVGDAVDILDIFILLNFSYFLSIIFNRQINQYYLY